MEKVARLLNEGVPQSEIAEALGITRSGVTKAKKRAEAQGLLNAGRRMAS
jgi:DNA-binding MarR family transcriptional regulator